MTVHGRDRAALDAFRDSVKLNLPGVETRLVLFGSKARGDDTAVSDIDVLVIVPDDDLRTRDAVYAASVDVSLAFGVVLSPKVKSAAVFGRMLGSGAPFARNVTREGVLL